MKATGIIRGIDRLGRIVIPIEIRRNLDINNKDSLEVYLENENIVYRKQATNESCSVVRKMDHIGRVTVPMEIRKTLGIDKFDQLELFVDGDKMIYRKYAPNGGCALCGEVTDKMTTHERTGKQVCRECVMSPVGK